MQFKIRQFKINQWIIEIGFGIGILLLTSTALMLAMQSHPEIPQQHSFVEKLMQSSFPAETVL